MEDNTDEKTKDYKEEFENNEELNDEEIDYQNENINNNDEKPKKNIKKIILITITIILIIVCIVCSIILLKKNKEQKNNTDKNDTPQEVVITRPDESLDYTIIKQSTFLMNCKNTSKGEKYKKLTKGLLIDCVFGYEVNTNQKVSELYFDLNNSANVKLVSTNNTSDYELLNTEKTYKLSSSKPDSVLKDSIHFYFEVLNDTDETGYVEISDIIFKDDNNKYYKVLNSIETFPPEYDDKLYIYKETYEDDDSVYYYSSKVKYTDDESNVELVDTFQCQNESCESKSEVNNYFLINDEKLILYNTLDKTSTTLNVPNDLKVDDYTYEIMLNKKNKIYGIAFKKNYVSAYDCDSNEYVCLNTGLSGYDIAYYSMALNNFSISLDYGFIGSSVYDDYDIALLLKKEDKIGVFSYEDDNMMLELSSKYKAAEYDSDTGSIMLEVYDNKNKNYYFEFFNPKYSSFVVDTNNLQKYDSSPIYYKIAYNRNGDRVTMFFDEKGVQLKKLPYVLSNKVLSVTDKIVINDELYKVYDLKGNLLYTSKYDVKDTLAYTKSYLIVNNENKIKLLNKDGEDIINIKDINDGVEFISASENENGVLTVIIKDSAITEEGKNAYKYTIETNKPFAIETINIQ